MTNDSHFLLIGIDGLRVGDIGTTVQAPIVGTVLAKGRVARIEMEVPTLSGPGWASILTGATHAEHGVLDNDFHDHKLHLYPDLLSRAFFANHDVHTFAAAGWSPLVDPAADPIVSSRPDQQRHGQHHVVFRNVMTYGYGGADGEVAGAALTYIEEHGPRASFLHFCETDYAAHMHGATSAEYAAAIRNIDGHIGRLLDTVGQRAKVNDEDWLVGFTTDHGHLDIGGHGGYEEIVRRSFLALIRYTRSEHWSVDGVQLPDRIAAHEIWRYLVGHVAELSDSMPNGSSSRPIA